jgi:uncharacterized iron-regulated membrane protein
MPETIRRATCRRTRRKFWLNIHLYLGLIGGAVLVVVAITGSILVFYIELQELLNQEQIVVSNAENSSRARQSLDQLVAAAERAKPPGSRFFKVYYPRNDCVAYKFLYFTDGKHAGNHGDGYYIFVDPYTAQTTGVQLWHPKGTDGKSSYLERPFVSLIMQLHYNLLLGSTGMLAVGILGVVMVLFVLSGLLLWWPLTGRFRQALFPQKPYSEIRINYLLHSLGGLYFSIILIAVLFSGVSMPFREQVNVIVKLLSPATTRGNVFEAMANTSYRSNSARGQIPLEYAKVESVVLKNDAVGQLWMLNAPQSSTDVFKVQKLDVHQWGVLGYQEYVIDQYSGKILDTYVAGTGSAGDIFWDLQWPLHSGHAFGWIGRTLVFLSGIVCLILYVTGVIRWLQKRRARAKQAARLATQTP